jgi:hypothetical protein
MLDVVLWFVPVDPNRDYAPLIAGLVASVRTHMPDARLVHLTVAGVEMLPGFDVLATVAINVDRKTLCRDRIVAQTMFMRTADRNTVFVDPDIEFQRSVEPVFDGSFDCGLLWRKKPDQPYNTGMIYAVPQSLPFWYRVARAAINLPKEVHGWWGDQLAFACVMGGLHRPGAIVFAEGVRVKLFDMLFHAPPPDQAQEWQYALHHKGPIAKCPSEKSGDGRSSLESAFSTAIATAPS